MKTRNPLADYLTSFLPLSEHELDELNKRTSFRSIKRRQFLLAAGDPCTKYTFIVKGSCKMYMVDSSGKQHNLHFAIENQWIVDVGSFHSGSESQLYIEAMEATDVAQISKPDLLYFYEHSIAFNRIFRVVVEDEPCLPTILWTEFVV